MSDRNYLGIFAQLAEFIPEDQVRFRDGANGGHYIKAPTAMNRLDSVVGPAHWWDDYRVIDELTVECSLTIRLPNGHTLTKRDVGIRKPTRADGKADAGASWKAAYSDAFKRAACKFGIARHLCKCGFADFVEHELQRLDQPPEAEAGSGAGAYPEPVESPPPTPTSTAAALPSQGRQPYDSATRPASDGHANGHGNGHGHPSSADKMPVTGKRLYAWAKKQEEMHQVGVIKFLNGWAKLHEFPGRMVDWDHDQVALAHAEAVRKLASIPARGDAYEGD